MSLRRQLLTSQKVGHIAVFVTLALSKESTTIELQLVRHHSAILVAILLQCCSYCSGVALYSTSAGWATAGLLVYTSLCSDYRVVRQPLPMLIRAQK